MVHLTMIVLFAVIIKNQKTLKYLTIFEKTLVLSIICSKCENDNEKVFKGEETIEILKIIGLIKYIYLLLKIWLRKT